MVDESSLNQNRRRDSFDAASSSLGPGADADSVAFLAIGRIVAPRGVRGELRVAIETQEPERFTTLTQVYLGEGHQPFVVQRGMLFKGQALLRLEGISDRNAAEAWRGAYVYVPIADALPLEEDEYYYFEVEGLRVSTTEGEELGEVVEVLATRANDVYVVHGPAGEILIPAIKQVVVAIDLEAGTMLVTLPPGLR
jgi:16S rRNA processing protein RimM